jgi:tetratricopeptide (TPR) repeat protein
MKRFLLTCLLLHSPLHAQAVAAPNADESETPIQAELLPNQEEFLNLPEEERTEFAKHFGNASRFFQQKRVFECLDAVSEAEAIFPRSAELLNLRGSCYVEMRAFDKATSAFNEALKITPKNTSIRFNVGEVLFVTKQWQQAHDVFQEVLREIPENNTALSRLVEFKIMLCKVKLGLKDEFTILAQKYDYQDDSPYHYYAQASLAYEKKELVEAEEWLGRANRIFQDPNIIAPWQDTLVEFGYIKSFYGDDSPSAD